MFLDQRFFESTDSVSFIVDDSGQRCIRFLQMGLVAGKSDAVAMVLKGILAGCASFWFLPSWEGFGVGFG